MLLTRISTYVALCSHQFPKNDDNSCSKCTAIYGIEPGFDLSVGPGYIRHVYDSIFFLSAAISAALSAVSVPSSLSSLLSVSLSLSLS